jgi:mRNA export factor
MWNLATNQQQQVAQHAAPVRHAFFIRQMNMIVTGSWDKTVKYWDLRSPNPAHTQQMPERVYAMDVHEELMVVGTADRQLQVGRGWAGLYAVTAGVGRQRGLPDVVPKVIVRPL